MKCIVVLAVSLFVCACASSPELMRLPPPEGLPQDRVEPRPHATVSPVDRRLNLAQLQSQLGLDRSPQSLGFDEKGFDGCKWGIREDSGQCGRRYLSVVHFRLLCRDSVETVQSVSTNFTPLTAHQMKWRLAGVRGDTRTDSEGFGQVQVLSPRSTKGQRFILIIGSKSLGLEVGEVSQIILPGNWCSSLAANPALSLEIAEEFSP